MSLNKTPTTVPQLRARIRQLEAACRCAAEALRLHDPQSPTALETDRIAAGQAPCPSVRPEDLTDEVLAGYFGEHCECRPLDIERTSHSHDCDDDHCEDVRVALGGNPTGWRGWRSTSEALIQARAAKQRICESLIEDGSGLALLTAIGKQLLDDAARFRASQE